MSYEDTERVLMETISEQIKLHEIWLNDAAKQLKSAEQAVKRAKDRIKHHETRLKELERKLP